jgi:putative flippase GtrA
MTLERIAAAAKNRNNYIQLIKFGFAGIITVSSDYITFLLCNNVFLFPLYVSIVASLAAGFVVSFILNRGWVFDAKSGRAQKAIRVQLFWYGSLFVFNAIFSFAAISYLEKLGIHANIGKLIALAFVVSWNFIIYKLVIFKLKA